VESSPHQWKKAVRYAAKSDIGLRRANNQDSFAIFVANSAGQWTERGHLFVVADGMGAHAAGEVASKCATDTITQSFLQRVKKEPPHQALANALYDAHNYIRERSASDDAFHDMGTTADALLLLPQGAVVAHVGDSRVYRLRGNVIEQLTFDHSLVWEVCMATNLAFDKAPSYIPRNQITRSLGPTDSLKVDLEGLYPIAIGDMFLLCSDGLSGQIHDTEIGQILSVFSPDLAVETLVNIANLRGGPDNITAIVVQAISPVMEEMQVELAKPIPLFTALSFAAGMTGLLGAGIVATIGQPIWAIVCLAVSLALLLMCVVTLTRRVFSNSIYNDRMLPFGKGPYTRTNCASDKKFVDSLSEILRELILATKNDRWSIVSDDADKMEREALNAISNKDYAVAIHCLAQAINYIMRELKRVSSKKRKVE
jgi:protein phosphatase